MNLAYEIRDRARHILWPVLAAMGVAYFGYHMVQGEYGLISYLRLTGEIETLETKLTEVQGERMAIERKVAALTPETLDPDMLDERARALLGFAGPDELIIYQR